MEPNGLHHHSCKFQEKELSILNAHFQRLNEISAERDKWVKEYIDRTMPIKSHFWILLGSLSILSTFAAAIQYIERISP